MNTRLQRLQAIRTRFGWKAVARDVFERVWSRLFRHQVIDVVWLDHEHLNTTLEADERFEFRFLTAEEVAEFSIDPENDLDPEMFQRVADGQDFCFAALCDGRLAAYGWYALNCVEAEHNFGVPMSYPADVAYMYKGFTHPDFRGNRLHGIGMGRALQSLRSHGVLALVSTIDWTNFASMRSSKRLGYEHLGAIVTVGDSNRIIRRPRRALVRGVRFGADAVSRAKRESLFETLTAPAQDSVESSSAAAAGTPRGCEFFENRK